MPQFDSLAFLSQLFWVFLCFFFLYLTLTFFILPSIAVVLKIRKKLVNFEKSEEIVDTDISRGLFISKSEPFTIRSAAVCKSQLENIFSFKPVASKALNTNFLACVSQTNLQRFKASSLVKWVHLTKLK